MFLPQSALKELRTLRLTKHRRAQGRYLMEGARLVGEALSSSAPIVQLLLTEPFARSDFWITMKARAESYGIQTISLTPTQAERLSATQHPQGIFAVVKLPDEQPDTAQLLRAPILILDELADPGNLGTLLRTADWFGIPTVWVSSSSADIYSPKVLRGGMGAHFHLPCLWQGELSDLAPQLAPNGITTLGATLDGKRMSQVKPSGDAWALVVGSEAHGLSPFWREYLDEVVTIPGSGRAESLNAAVAAGIMLYHLQNK